MWCVSYILNPMRPKVLYWKQDTDHLGPRCTYPASTPEKDKGDYTTKKYIFESMGVMGDDLPNS